MYNLSHESTEFMHLARGCVFCVFPLCVFLLCNTMATHTITACLGPVCYGCYTHCPPPPPHPWCPGLTPARRMRELEEELRLMDQNLKSMVCGEEEVLAVRSPAFCSSDLQALSRFLCFLSNLHLSSVTLITTITTTSSSTETLSLVIFYTVPVSFELRHEVQEKDRVMKIQYRQIRLVRI